MIEHLNNIISNIDLIKKSKNEEYKQKIEKLF